MVLLLQVGGWYKRHAPAPAKRRNAGARPRRELAARQASSLAIVILVVLMFSKNVYTASLSTYYTFYLIEKFRVSVQSAQMHLFLFLAAVGVGHVDRRHRSATASAAST